MRTPEWYEDGQSWLLDHGGREAVTAALGAVIVISLGALYAMWAHGQVLPAAGWAAWALLP